MTTCHIRRSHGSLARAVALLHVLTAALFTFHTHAAASQTLAAPEPGIRVKPVLTFPEGKIAIKQWMAQHQWESKRHDPSRFEVGNRQLRLVSQGDSIMIGTTHGFPIDPHAWPRLRMRLRVTKNPSGADNAKKSGDDAAFRVYVTFDRGKTLFGPSRTIVYLWTEDVAAETFIKSPYYSKKLRYLSIGMGVTDTTARHRQWRKNPGQERQDDAGWVTIERHLLQDYRRAFPRDTRAVPALGGILLKCDSNNTGTSAEAWLAQLDLLAPAR